MWPSGWEDYYSNYKGGLVNIKADTVMKAALENSS